MSSKQPSGPSDPPKIPEIQPVELPAPTFEEWVQGVVAEMQPAGRPRAGKPHTGDPLAQQLLASAEQCERELGPCEVTNSAWNTFAKYLRKRRRYKDAKRVEDEKCLPNPISINLVDIANRAETKGEELAQEVAQQVAEPFYVYGATKLVTYCPEQALQFLLIYLRLRSDLAKLIAWFSYLSQKYNLGSILEDPSAYNIEQVAINAVRNKSEYTSITKRTHAYQATGCLWFESSNYIKSIQSFWSSLIERMFKSTLFYINAVDFAFETTQETTSETAGSIDPVVQRHEDFVQTMFDIVEMLAMTIQELDAGPPRGTVTTQFVLGSQTYHTLSAKCLEKMKELIPVMRKINKNENRQPLMYKRKESVLRISSEEARLLYEKNLKNVMKLKEIMSSTM
jgi:hypothetical protein